MEIITVKSKQLRTICKPTSTRSLQTPCEWFEDLDHAAEKRQGQRADPTFRQPSGGAGGITPVARMPACNEMCHHRPKNTNQISDASQLFRDIFG